MGLVINKVLLNLKFNYGNDLEPVGVIVVACPDQGEGTDPEALGLVINKVLLNLKESSIMKLL